MRTVDIPGGTAQLREKQDIKVRQRQLIESRAVAASSALEKLPDTMDELEAFDLSKSGMSAAEADSLFALQSATIVAALASWSLPDPLPTIDTIDDMDQELYDALGEVTTSVGKEIVKPDVFDPPSPHSEEFLSSPTTPSDDSVIVSRADQAPLSMTPQQNATPSTASVEPSQV
jgi:hypothetical protein